MDKVLSTRLPEEVIDELEEAARRLGITKKQFIEEAIRLRARAASRERTHEIIARAAGAWKRKEPPERTIEEIGTSFRRSWRRFEDDNRQE
jgi:hypothetical protein